MLCSWTFRSTVIILTSRPCSHSPLVSATLVSALQFSYLSKGNCVICDVRNKKKCKDVSIARMINNYPCICFPKVGVILSLCIGIYQVKNRTASLCSYE